MRFATAQMFTSLALWNISKKRAFTPATAPAHLPPYTLSPAIQGRLAEQTIALAKALKVRGLINIQFAVKDDEIFVLEANPRASRTVPFVAKAVGAPIAGIAAKDHGWQRSHLEFDLIERNTKPHRGERSRLPVCALSRALIPCLARRCAQLVKSWAGMTISLRRF